MTISEKRRQIDAIDEAIIDLLIKRSATSREISKIKFSAGLPIADRQRETEVISKVLDRAGDRVSDEAIFQVYEAIMAESRRVQRDVRKQSIGVGALR